MKKILISALAIAAMASCSQSPLQEEPGSMPNKKIAVKSKVTQSRAIAADGAAFGLQYVRADKAATTWTGALKDATHSANNSISLSENYLTSGENSFFKFFSDGGTKAGTKITWTPSGSTDIVYNIAAWDAGNYTTPLSSGLTLDHMLTRVEVIIEGKAGEATSAIAATWGNISGITIAGLPTSVIYDYAAASDAITYGALTDKTSAVALLASNTYTTPFAPVAIGASGNTTVVGCVMLPSGTAISAAKLIIDTVTSADQEIDVTFSGALEAGKINTITLTFSAKDKVVGVSSSVANWEVGETGSGSI